MVKNWKLRGRIKLLPFPHHRHVWELQFVASEHNQTQILRVILEIHSIFLPPKLFQWVSWVFTTEAKHTLVKTMEKLCMIHEDSERSLTLLKRWSDQQNREQKCSIWIHRVLHGILEFLVAACELPFCRPVIDCHFQSRCLHRMRKSN